MKSADRLFAVQDDRSAYGLEAMIFTGPRKFFLPLLAALPLGGCEALNFGIVNHAGPVAEQSWHLYLIVGAVLIFVAGPVLLLTPLFAWYYRISGRNSQRRFAPDWDFSWWVEGLIWLPPAGIVIGLAVVVWRYTDRLDPYRPLVSTRPALEVQAVGFDWKWLFIYPGQRVAAVNQLAIPVGTPVHLRLTSGTVMQSLLVPQLAGQIYAMAGMRTELNLGASRVGTYRGLNTQYNGLGFQNEHFDVIALSPADYAKWLARVRASARPLDGAALDQLFKRSIAAEPIFYAKVPPTLFEHVMMRATASGQHP